MDVSAVQSPGKKKKDQGRPFNGLTTCIPAFEDTSKKQFKGERIIILFLWNKFVRESQSGDYGNKGIRMLFALMQIE